MKLNYDSYSAAKQYFFIIDAMLEKGTGKKKVLKEIARLSHQFTDEPGVDNHAFREGIRGHLRKYFHQKRASLNQSPPA